MPTFPTTQISQKFHRLINSRWPTIGVFDGLFETEAEQRQLFELEQMTNPRHMIAIGRLAQIPDGGMVSGLTASLVMAAFVHCHHDGARFNSGRLGAWYAAMEVKTAIEETVYHLTRRLALSEGGFPTRIQMRHLVSTTNRPLLDLRGKGTEHPDLYDPDDYDQSQSFGDRVRWPFAQKGVAGLIFDSVRRQGGTNICIYEPKALALPIVQGDHFDYVWDPDGAVQIAKLTKVKR